MVAASSSQIPSIEITLAVAERPESILNTVLPFTPIVPSDYNPTRPYYLSPPPTMHPNDAALRQSLQRTRGEGLERDKFEALLNSTRERRIRSYNKDSGSLAKDVTSKAHVKIQTKQAERRALFQSKIKAPPSPSAIYMPRTPPESPAIYHCSLPSPGLKSPLAIFDNCNADNFRETWIEQIKFYPSQKESTGYGSGPLNVISSIDQYSNENGSHSKNKQMLSSRFDGSGHPRYDSSRDGAKEILSTNNNRQRDFPSKSSQSYLPPVSPLIYSELHTVTTLISERYPRCSSQLTKANLDVFNNRQRTANAMLSTIRKRTIEVR